jgi:DNA-binding response OmpR family regulator
MLQVKVLEIARVEPAAQGSSRILLVQSDPDLSDALIQACEPAGLYVHACTTVVVAQETCRRHIIDIVVVDWLMEGFFADDLLKLLSAAFHPRPLPTTLVLSRMGDAATRECLRPDSPIHGVLTRPTNSEQFAGWAPKFAAVLKRCQRPRERTHGCMRA